DWSSDVCSSDLGSPQGAEFSADHFNPYGDEKARIRIRKESASGTNRGRLLSCEELWACVVFEIENLRNHKACIALYEMAIKGQVTREQWILENSRLEYEALRRTSSDYVRLWQPLAASYHLASTTPKNRALGTNLRHVRRNSAF